MRPELLDEYLTRISNNFERLADALEKISDTLRSIDVEAWNELKAQLEQKPAKTESTKPFLEEDLTRILFLYTRADQEEIKAVRSKIIDLSKETSMTLLEATQYVTRLALSGQTISQILNHQYYLPNNHGP